MNNPGSTRRHSRAQTKATVVRWAKQVGQAVALSGLLVAGTLWTVTHARPAFVNPTAVFRLPASVVEASGSTEEAFRIGQVLVRHTANEGLAFRIADALVSEGARQRLRPELLVGILLTEDESLDPRAKSPVGAKGLMQVMPFHSGKWGCTSHDLFDVEGNICHGVKILKQAIAEAPSLRKGLLRYNGCVRGTFTRDCHTYDDKVLRHVNRTTDEMRQLRAAVAE